MRYHKAGGATLRMLMDPAVPRRSDGALALCQTCQRRMWFAGGYLDLLANQLSSLARAVETARAYVKALRSLEMGECRGLTSPYRERAVGLAKELADELGWALLIQRRGHECLKITRVPHPAQTLECGAAL